MGEEVVVRYKIHRLRESQRATFRSAPHTPGLTQVKPKDYEEAGMVEAANAYAAWVALKGTGEALEVGDLIESEHGELRICKFVGFEEAQWLIPEPLPPLAESSTSTTGIEA
jgi:hypothetical protein